jgi:acetyltransferase-like isoleucine patch superfamily enzyme
MDRLPHVAYVVNRRARFVWGTWQAYLRCRWWRIDVGRGCRFHGKTFFRRYPLSKIVIGNECTFLSSPNANLIGINRPCMISTMAREAQVRIGSGCGFSGTVIAAFKEIVLGQNVICGANTLITDADWHPEDPRAGIPAPVLIGSNVWLGVNATILKGVHIGENSVVGAGSVVVSDVPANVVAAGNPCRVIRSLGDSDEHTR